MADISELILQVKNADNAVREIDKVDKKLKQTAISSKKLNDIGKTLFAGWTFTKIISMTKAMGDAFSNSLITARKFSSVFGLWNRQANAGVKILVDNFNNTERAAKDLMATIGARLNFGFDEKTLGKVSTDLAKISHELGSFYGKNVNDVSLKLTQALAGQTKGLKEYGINIDINSEKFKALAQSIKESTGETVEGSRALAVYSNILGKTKYVEGTFATSAKSISQIMEDIKNAFVDGPLTQAGRILTEVFGPILKGINKILNVQTAKGIAALTLSLAALAGTVKTIWVVLSGFASFIGLPQFLILFKKVSIELALLTPRLLNLLANIIGIMAQISAMLVIKTADMIALMSKQAALLLLQISKWITGIVLTISGSLLSTLNVMFFATLAAGIIYALAYALDTVVNFTKTWGVKLYNFGRRYFEDLVEKFDNYLKLGKFDKTELIVAQSASEWLASWEKRIQEVETADEKINEATKELNALVKKRIKTPTLEQFYQLKGALISKLETVADQRDLEEAAKKEYEKAKKLFDRVKVAVASTTAYAKEIEGKVDLVDKAEQRFIDAKKKYQEYQKLIAQAADKKFANFSWYTDLLSRIKSTIDKLTPEEKVQDIKKKIDKFKEAYKNVFLNPDELKSKYKELGDLEIQKLEAEMGVLQKEREFIASTNEMIKKYVDQAMQWKAQGVDAIETTSAEGYKFMTSGFGSLAELGPILKENQNENKVLQIKANAIAEKSKNILEGIKNKIDKIDSTGLGGTIKIVN